MHTEGGPGEDVERRRTIYKPRRSLTEIDLVNILIVGFQIKNSSRNKFFAV